MKNDVIFLKNEIASFCTNFYLQKYLYLSKKREENIVLKCFENEVAFRKCFANIVLLIILFYPSSTSSKPFQSNVFLCLVLMERKDLFSVGHIAIFI